MPSFSQSRFAARLQEKVSLRRSEVGLYREIASHLPKIETGRVLDVGTGTGLQLKDIHDLNPALELFGLDLSAQAIKIAESHLVGLEVDLRVGNIEHTTYEDDFFHIITCNSSMSYWKDLASCFDEIYRILAPGGVAMLFEPRKNIDIDAALEIIKDNLAGEPWLQRFAAVNLNRFGLRWGRTLGLHLYQISEIEAKARISAFKDTFTVTPVTLQNLPIFMQVKLGKPR